MGVGQLNKSLIEWADFAAVAAAIRYWSAEAMIANNNRAQSRSENLDQNNIPFCIVEMVMMWLVLSFSPSPFLPSNKVILLLLVYFN